MNDNEPGYNLKKCRMCFSKKIYHFLDLESHPPSDAFLTKEKLNKPEVFFPLRVVQCEDCGLTQLSYIVNPKILYGEDYIYQSSITQTGKNHFFNMAKNISEKLHLNKESFVVDIGSNVGVLLEGFKNNGMRTLGIDPAPNICKIANERGIETWNDFINVSVAQKIVLKKNK